MSSTPQSSPKARTTSSKSTQAQLDHVAAAPQQSDTRPAKELDPENQNTATAAAATTTSISMFKNMMKQSTLDIPIAMYQNTSSPVQDLIKVYVYDTLPSNLSTDLMDDVIQNAYEKNHITDVILINLFETFPGRTYDPAQADIFVVPYPHITHCFHSHKRTGYKLYCGNLPMAETTSIFQHLPYYDRATAHKHLLLLADGEYQAQRWLVKKPLLTMYGPIWEDGVGTYDDHSQSPLGHILVPPFNSRPEM
jgi:hypothetical protein